MRGAPVSGIITLVLLAVLAPTASAADTDSMRPMGTRVSGVLTGDLTWDVAGSPYWLEGGVRLSAGSRLRIEPGVQVMFNESGLNVEGDLEALGTPANPILFTRNGTSPLVVYVISSGGSMVFRNASFDFVTPGMGDVPGADFVLDNATLRLTVGPFINAARNVVITRSRIALTAASNGIAFSGSSSITISHNLITSWPGSPVGSGIQDSTGGGPFPMNRRVTIVGNVVEGSGFGLGIWVRSNGTLVARNEVSNLSDWGIYVTAPGVQVVGNLVHDNPIGISFYGTTSAGGSIVENEVSNNSWVGVYLQNTQSLYVSRNVVVNNSIGMDTSGSSNVTLVENTLRENPRVAAIIGGPSHRIYHNSFLYNGEMYGRQVQDYLAGRAWDDGYPTGGNYWSDYAGTDSCSGPGQDVCTDSDGIGDSPYMIPLAGGGGAAQDNYPLMQSFTDVSPPAVSIASPSDGAIVGSAAVTVQGTASDGLGSGVARVEVRANGGPWRMAAGRTAWTLDSVLSPGPNLVEARAWDFANLVSSPVGVTVSYVRTPVVRISSPSDLSVVTVPSFLVTGSSTDAGEVQVQTDDGPWLPAVGTAAWSLILGPLANGAHAIRARGFNGTVPSAVAQVDVFVSLPVPALDVLAPVEGSRVSGTVILSGTATPGAFILLRIDGGVWIDIGVAGGDGTWARPWDSAEVALGPHTLEFKATKDGQESAAVARHITVVQTAAAGGIPGIVLLAVGVALLFLALFAWRRRSRPARRPGVEDSAPPEGSSSQPR